MKPWVKWAIAAVVVIIIFVIIYLLSKKKASGAFRTEGAPPLVLPEVENCTKPLLLFGSRGPEVAALNSMLFNTWKARETDTGTKAVLTGAIGQPGKLLGNVNGEAPSELDRLAWNFRRQMKQEPQGVGPVVDAVDYFGLHTQNVLSYLTNGKTSVSTCTVEKWSQGGIR